MRIIYAVKNDIKFQIKYGFYLLYFVISLIYISLIYFIPYNVKSIVASIIIFSDPVALGMIFMGAIILFEKSECVLNSLFISPLKKEEYIISKILSIAIISTLSSVAIIIFSLDISKVNLFSLLTGIILGSIMASLIGIIVASNINSINQFIVKIIPLGTFISFPPLTIFLGLDNQLLNILPGNIILKFILEGVGIGKSNPIYLIILLLWLALFWQWSKINILRMLMNLGGSRYEIQ